MKIILIIIILAFTNTVHSQWVQTNGPYDVYNRCFALSGNNIYAGTNGDQGSIYLTSDNGQSWSVPLLTSHDIYAIATNGSYIYAGSSSSGGGVYISSNGGLNWTQTLVNNGVWSLEINTNFVFAGTGGGLFFTTNDGQNWAQTSLPSEGVNTLALSGLNLFAGTGWGTGNGAVYLSTNNGMNWIQTALNNQHTYSITINGSNIFAAVDNGIYLNTNNGQGWWTQVLNNTGWVRALVNNGNNIFAGTESHGIYLSTNNGQNWVQKNEGLGNLNISSLLIANGYIFAGTWGSAVWRRPLSELIGIFTISSNIPNNFNLSQNYPNPFNPSTNIKFDIPKSSIVQLTVYDILGREVAKLVQEQLKLGSYSVDWNGSNYSSGVYFYKLSAGDFLETKKMLLIK